MISLFLAAPEDAVGDLLFNQRVERRRGPGGGLLRDVPEQGADHSGAAHCPAERIGGFLAELLEKDVRFTGERMRARNEEGFLGLLWRGCHTARSYLIQARHHRRRTNRDAHERSVRSECAMSVLPLRIGPFVQSKEG